MRNLVVVGLLALVACTASRTPSGGVDVDPVSDVVGDWTTQLQPMNNSNVRGTTSVRSAATSAEVTINITGATGNSHHPWHVHRGTCATDGPIHGDANAYTPLHVAQNGTASATAKLGVALNEDERYHVNVHKSPTELNVIISCGDLND